MCLTFYYCTYDSVVEKSIDQTIAPEVLSQVELSFSSVKDNTTAKSSKSVSTTSTIKEKTARILLSINDANGNPVYENHTVELVRVGEDILSIPLIFTATGTYRITLFQVLDENNDILAMTPRANTPLSVVVTTTLDYSFSVDIDNTQRINLDVVAMNAKYSAEDFGYSTFSFNEVNLTVFQVGVFSYNATSTNFELISSTITLTHLASCENLHSGTYAATTVSIPVAPFADDVNLGLTVASPGYTTYVTSMTFANFLRYRKPEPQGDGPLIIILKKASNSISLENTFNGGLFNGKEYQLVTFATGRIWLDRNLGADGVATSTNDASSYGDLFQWGRETDGHEKRNSSTTTTLSNSNNPGHNNFIISFSSPYDWRSPQNNNLLQGVNGVNNPCPAGFRVPTDGEWNQEINTWTSKNITVAYTSPLKLPTAGYRSDDAGLVSAELGCYYSNATYSFYSYALNISNINAVNRNHSRGTAFSIRCIKN